MALGLAYASAEATTVKRSAAVSNRLSGLPIRPRAPVQLTLRDYPGPIWPPIRQRPRLTAGYWNISCLSDSSGCAADGEAGAARTIGDSRFGSPRPIINP